jgi:hypothetical protein
LLRWFAPGVLSLGIIGENIKKEASHFENQNACSSICILEFYFEFVELERLSKII